MNKTDAAYSIQHSISTTADSCNK